MDRNSASPQHPTTHLISDDLQRPDGPLRSRQALFQRRAPAVLRIVANHDDILFALVLAVAAASAALLAWASADGSAGVPAITTAAHVQLERVVLTARREPAAVSRVELPRVVVSAKRLLPAAVKAVARASNVDGNS